MESVEGEGATFRLLRAGATDGSRRRRGAQRAQVAATKYAERRTRAGMPISSDERRIPGGEAW